MIDWDHWLAQPPGRYFLAWEQAQFDYLVSDSFGYQAAQLGLPQLRSLRENRISQQAMVLEAKPSCASGHLPFSHLARFDALPFANESMDLIVLPHALEHAAFPYAVLQEVYRVLRPEGRLLLSGFNPASLWGVYQGVRRVLGRHWMPQCTQLIACHRIKEWLISLDFEIDGGRFGCYRPPTEQEKWLARWAFMEHMGDRWWPVFGAGYILSAVKRISGMHLIEPNWRHHRGRNVSFSPAGNPATPYDRSKPCKK